MVTITSELVRNITTSVAAIVAVTAAVIGAAWKLAPHIRSWWDRRTLTLRLSAEAYGPDDIKNYTRYYVQPDFQSADPSGAEEFRRIVATREPLFQLMDRVLHNPGAERFIIILADSGMGKTSFLLNYYARHWRSWRRRRKYDIHLVSLSRPGADKQISAIPEADRKKTAIFLDALDEDQSAIEDHRRRLAELIDLTRDFRVVAITCRTQCCRPSPGRLPKGRPSFRRAAFVESCGSPARRPSMGREGMVTVRLSGRPGPPGSTG